MRTLLWLMFPVETCEGVAHKEVFVDVSEHLLMGAQMDDDLTVSLWHHTDNAMYGWYEYTDWSGKAITTRRAMIWG